MTRVILVKKLSAWQQHHESGQDFGKFTLETQIRLVKSHEAHTANVRLVEGALKELKITPWVVEGIGLNFQVPPGALVITIGGDGAVLASSHHIGPDAFILAVNSDPKNSRGRFCNVYSKQALLVKAIEKALSPKRKVTMIPRMAISVDDEVVHRRVLNEVLFSHSCPAAMTRVAPPGKVRYACSGLWIGTAAGSSGAIRSAGGKVWPITAQRLQTIVREPCEQAGTKSLVWEAESFEFTSLTADATLFIDGAFFRVPVGFEQVMRFKMSDEPLPMVGRVPT